MSGLPLGSDVGTEAGDLGILQNFYIGLKAPLCQRERVNFGPTPAQALALSLR